jgi:3-phenylpropionate/trans-cinnamate dioxygenase ferredoxin subunit
MTVFIGVAQAEDIRPGQAVQVWVGNEPIAVVNLDGDFYAISDICTHEEFFLHGGVIEGEEIECPLHRGVFNIKTGSAEVYPAERDLPTFPCRVVDGEVQVALG